jgi:hypothetical protein
MQVALLVQKDHFKRVVAMSDSACHEQVLGFVMHNLRAHPDCTVEQRNGREVLSRMLEETASLYGNEGRNSSYDYVTGGDKRIAPILQALSDLAAHLGEEHKFRNLFSIIPFNSTWPDQVFDFMVSQMLPRDPEEVQPDIEAWEQW